MSLPYATVKEKQLLSFLCREKPSSFLTSFLPVSLLYYSQKTLHFWAPNVCKLFPTPSNSLTPAACSTISQFWHCVLGDSLRHCRLRAQSHKTDHSPPAIPPTTTSDTSCKLRFSPVLLTNYRSSKDLLSLGSINLLEQFTELRKTLMFTSLL